MEPKEKRKPEPVLKKCHLCSETYDEAKDPYHLEACRDAQKP